MPYYVLDDISRTKGVTRKCPVHFQVTQGVLLDCVMTNFKPLFSVNDMPVISPLSRYLATGQRERLNSCLSKGQDCKRNVQCLTNSVFLSSNRDAPNTHTRDEVTRKPICLVLSLMKLYWGGRNEKI